ADPRKSAWWNSDTPRTSHDINVHDNVVNNIAGVGSHGFLFINWTGGAPDQSQVEVSRVNVHDNTFSAPYPVGALVTDPYHAGSKTPTKDLKFNNNTLLVAGTGAPTRGLDATAVTDFSGDITTYPFALATDTTGLYNSDFDAGNSFPAEKGTSFW